MEFALPILCEFIGSDMVVLIINIINKESK